MNPRLISVLALAALAVLALVLVLQATPEGLGLSDDSIAYIAGARSMLAGNGYREAWLASNGPVTHFPPAYPAVLAFLGRFGLDPLRGARFLGALLYGLNTVLLGILGWRMTRSLVAGLVLAALFAGGEAYLRVHSMALSEPLFVFLSLLSMWMFDLYHERDEHWLWLVACGAFVGMAYLTRYAALGLAATYMLALFVLHRTWRRRLFSTCIFSLGVLPWVIGWAIRNAAVGGTATNRVLAWHPVPLAKLQTALHAATSFLVPVEPWRQAFSAVPGIMLVAVLTILSTVLVYGVLRGRQLSSPRGNRVGEVISFINALYVFGYLGAILLSMSVFDASTKFKLRILAPAYVAILVLAVTLGFWLWHRRRVVAISLALCVAALSTYGQVEAVRELSRGGQGYASFKWYDSQAMAFLRNLPAGVMVYTNEPGAVYLYARRPAYVLPDRVDPVTAAQRADFDRGLQELQADVRQGRAVLALFSGGDATAEDAAALSAGLALIHKSGGAEIFGAAP